jgi:hypothetical protein
MQIIPGGCPNSGFELVQDSVVSLLIAGARIVEERLAGEARQVHLTVEIAAGAGERTSDLDVKQGCSAGAAPLEVRTADARQADDPRQSVHGQS